MYLLPYLQYLKYFERKHFTTKVGKFSIAIPHSVVITWSGLAA